MKRPRSHDQQERCWSGGDLWHVGLMRGHTTGMGAGAWQRGVCMLSLPRALHCASTGCSGPKRRCLLGCRHCQRVPSNELLPPGQTSRRHPPSMIRTAGSCRMCSIPMCSLSRQSASSTTTSPRMRLGAKEQDWSLLSCRRRARAGLRLDGSPPSWRPRPGSSAWCADWWPGGPRAHARRTSLDR